jgi:hypothetical protein
MAGERGNKRTKEQAKVGAYSYTRPISFVLLFLHTPAIQYALDKYEQMFYPISCEQMRDVETPRWGVWPE